MIRIPVCFGAGGFILSVCSIIQKIVIGAPLVLHGFVVPFVFGGFGGLLFCSWARRRKDREKELSDLNKALNTKFEKRSEEIRKALAEKEVLLDRVSRSEERYRKLIENSVAGIGVSHEGQILFVNQALCQMFGIEDEETIRSKKPFGLCNP